MSAPDIETPISALARIDHAEAMDLTVVEHDRFHTQIDALEPDGYVSLPQRPGLGYEIEWGYIQEHAVEL